MFEVVSVKDNSVRIRTGCITFDVLVHNYKGKLMIHKPAGIYMIDGWFDRIVAATLAAYTQNNMRGN